MQKLSILLNFINKINNMSLYSLFTPSLILMILCMLILPLPTFFLDLFFTFNIVISIIILIVSMVVTDVLNFSSFPIVSLLSTLLRLSLNVASTRVILLNGHTGSYSAGRIIESFGVFLIGKNFFIGIIVFIILVIINFIVVTKGSGRIAEVGARFILDAMPGKQMAIDADLNAGIISEREAKERRINVYKEADFYGSMDGASKFIRGDAVAGILIIIVNIVGGLVIGITQHNMSFLQAAKTYSILTIGDGLAAQIPSLIISIASGIILTRVGSDKINVSKQIINQIFDNSQVIFLSSVIFGIFSLIPGMPNFIFLSFTISLLILSWYLYNKNYISKNFSKVSNVKKNKLLGFSWNDIQFEHLIALELSSIFFQSIYKDKYNYLLKKIYFLRKNIAKDFGFLISDIYLINNRKLEDGQYKILIKGAEIGCGYVFLDKLLAINNSNSIITVPGIKVKEPVFDLPAFWIHPDNKEKIIKKKLLIVEPNSVIITHINNIIRKNLYELFGLQETQQLLDRISQTYPRLVEYLIPNIISITMLHSILQNLLRENIPIKDIRTILETLIKHGSGIKNNVEKLTDVTRIALRNFITQKFFLNVYEICVLGLSADIECILLKIINNKDGQLEPVFSENLINKTKLLVIMQKKNKFPLVLVVHPQLRSLLARLFMISIPELIVLSFSEISEDRTIKIVHTIGKYKD
ncbi:Flagellar biosynthesis protein FlhA [Buchnera aphidicola (Cinara kochiana kochiana)]|uniref:Flagellar biosynthesis protein FlhA n=1 Tax=Buchnera aphidicola (Cinara kochiana kochiana) TaxID=2518976 RepID=A0A451D5I2_9GAMM|nr:FHIPEP family type III secretion protein [Buchnera aphidicola]VFP81076.1 Flagellar biosynthesis protein FlhA [Buchnera aphidicola (Cinara kochiana kochiana)]